MEALTIPDEIKDYECPYLSIDNGSYYCTDLARAGSVCVVQCAPGYERVKRTKSDEISTTLMSSNRKGFSLTKLLFLAHSKKNSNN